MKIRILILMIFMPFMLMAQMINNPPPQTSSNFTSGIYNYIVYCTTETNPLHNSNTNTTTYNNFAQVTYNANFIKLVPGFHAGAFNLNGYFKTKSVTLSAEIQGSADICYAAFNGHATVNVCDGVPPYTFNWYCNNTNWATFTPSNTVASSTISGLGYNTPSANNEYNSYFCVITDNAGNSITKGISMLQHSNIITSEGFSYLGSTLQIACLGGTHEGKVNVFAVGGVSPYTFHCSNNFFAQTSASPHTFSSPAYSSSYPSTNVYVTDAQGCISTSSCFRITKYDITSATFTSDLRIKTFTFDNQTTFEQYPVGSSGYTDWRPNNCNSSWDKRQTMSVQLYYKYNDPNGNLVTGYTSPTGVYGPNTSISSLCANDNFLITRIRMIDPLTNCELYDQSFKKSENAPTISIYGDLNDNCHLKGDFNVSRIENISYNWTLPSGVQYTINHDSLHISSWNSLNIDTIFVVGIDSNWNIVYQGQKIIDPSTLSSPTIDSITINGTIEDVCHQRGIFSVTPLNNITYTWAAPYGSIYNAKGAQDDTLNLRYWANWTNQSPVITVEGRNTTIGCLLYHGQKLIDPTTFPPLPPPTTIPINGFLNCQLQGNFSVTSLNGIGYNWDLPTSVDYYTNGLNNENMGVRSWGSFNDGIITVIGYDTIGCLMYQGKDTIHASTYPPPPEIKQIVIHGDLNTGCGPQGNFYVTPDTGFTYIWSLPNGVTYTTSGSQNQNLNVIWNYSGIGVISVVGIDANGCPMFQGEISIPYSNTTCTAMINSQNYFNNISAVYIDQTYFAGQGYTPSGGYSTNNTLYFDGIIHIDEDFYLHDCPNIYMGPNAKFIIDPGYTFTIENSHIQSCQCPWDGIYAEDASSNIIVINDTIQDAYNAILSNNSGNFTAYNTIFVNNQTGIKVKNNNINSNPGYIALCTFESDPNFGGPFSIDNLITGIFIDSNTTTLTIGDNNNPFITNHFIATQFGIKANNSDAIYIYNNSFEKIGISSNNPPSYIGTYSIANEAAIFSNIPSRTIQGNLIIGSNNLPIINNFNYCNIGVFACNTHVDIEYNNFTNQQYVAIHLKDCQYGSFVNNNIINMDTNSVMRENSIGFSTAIFAEMTEWSLVNDLNITSNTIDQSHIGITLNNCSGNDNVLTPVQCNIDGNTITNLVEPFGIGINAMNSDYVTIQNNIINSSVIGINLDYIQKSMITKNNLLNISNSGVYVSNPSLYSQYSCNNFNQSYYGFYFNWATISDQLPFVNNVATDNIWLDDQTQTTALRRMSGYINNYPGIYWRHQDNTSDYYSTYCPYLVPNNGLSNRITSVPNQNPNLNCGSNKSFTLLIDNNKQLNQIIGNKTSYDTLFEENIYMAKEFAYNLLENKSDLINASGFNNSNLQDFYNIIKNTNIGNFTKVHKFIMDKNFVEAKKLNTIIVPQNLIESNYKAVNSIYIDRLINNYIVSANDSLTLVKIAKQSPSTGGKAVYSARAILDLYPSSIVQQNNITPSFTAHSKYDNSSIRVYPNPANDKLFIELDNTIDCAVKFEIYDLSGKLIYSNSLITTQKLQSINISSIKEGIYNLRITGNKITNNQKIVIIR